MNKQRGFTLIELLVVIAIISLLMSILMPALAKVKVQAVAVSCMARISQWGIIFSMYTGDNDCYFHKRQIGNPQGWMRLWPYTYKPLYKDPKMRFCPAAENINRTTGPLVCWGAGNYNNFGSWNPQRVQGENQDCWGSYGMSRLVENIEGGAFGDDPIFWRTACVKGGDRIPVFFDCLYSNNWGDNGADPPEYNGDFDNEMKCTCIDRHGGGFTNMLFLDWSAKKVPLKKLWTIQWGRTSDTCGPWSICGCGSKQNCANMWDAQSPWMSQFPEF